MIPVAKLRDIGKPTQVAPKHQAKEDWLDTELSALTGTEQTSIENPVTKIVTIHTLARVTVIRGSEDDVIGIMKEWQ